MKLSEVEKVKIGWLLHNFVVGIKYWTKEEASTLLAQRKEQFLVDLQEILK